MTRFDYISDLHLDFYGKPREVLGRIKRNQKSDILLLGGDNANSSKKSVDVLKELSHYYSKIVFVDGNHEYYDGREYCKALMDFTKVDKVHLLHKDESLFVIDDVAVIGCNGWYNFDVSGPSFIAQKWAWKQGMNDSRLINFGQTSPEYLANRDFKYLLELVSFLQTKENINKIVVMTHTIPLESCIAPKYRNKGNQPLNGSFVNTNMQKVLEADTKDKIKIWLFGHSHEQSDQILANIRFINNAFGYPGENSRPSLITLEV